MKHRELIQVEIPKLIKITCDSCSKEIDFQSRLEEVIEINHSFGYGSNGKDGDEYNFDLCENCFDKIISSFDNNLPS